MKIQLLLLASWITGATTTFATQGPPLVFLPVTNPSSVAVAASPVPRAEVRRRALEPDFALFQSLAQGAATRCQLNLFPDSSFVANVKSRIIRNAQDYSLAGGLAEDALGDFTLAVRHGAMAGVIRLPRQNKTFRLESRADGTHAVVELDSTKFGACGCSPANTPARALAAFVPAGGPVGDPAPCDTDDGTVIDVLVVYTSAARAAAGGSAAMQAEVQLAVDTANAAYENSGVFQQLRLVHAEEINYDEAGTLDDHLNNLTAGGGSEMARVHALRDEFGADLVSLMVEDDDRNGAETTCGTAWLLTAGNQGIFRSMTFSVVNRGCASANFSFAHELGHNTGCNHDVANAGSAGYQAWSYGWRFTGNSGAQFRTVMAEGSGTRIGYFSNPGVNFDGQPTGSATVNGDAANNARTLITTARRVANWGTGPKWVDFAYQGQEFGCYQLPFNTLVEAVNASPTGGRVMVKTGSTDETLQITKRLRLEAFGGPATIGRQ